MEAGKNSVIYMVLISGPNKADDTCGRTSVTGTMDRGFTLFVEMHTFLSLYKKLTETITHENAVNPLAAYYSGTSFRVAVYSSVGWCRVFKLLKHF
jgi:hypothetical protein